MKRNSINGIAKRKLSADATANASSARQRRFNIIAPTAQIPYSAKIPPAKAQIYNTLSVRDNGGFFGLCVYFFRLDFAIAIFFPTYTAGTSPALPVFIDCPLQKSFYEFFCLGFLVSMLSVRYCSACRGASLVVRGFSMGLHGTRHRSFPRGRCGHRPLRLVSV